MKMTLTSNSFTEGRPISAVHTCEGRNVSPELSWMNAPEEARSFAIAMAGIDGENAPRVHWLVFDIPAGTHTVREGDHSLGLAAKNDLHHDGYSGPCPPPRKGDHRYVFTLYALDVETLDLPAGTRAEGVMQAMRQHVLATTELRGRFRRE